MHQMSDKYEWRCKSDSNKEHAETHKQGGKAMKQARAYM